MNKFLLHFFRCTLMTPCIKYQAKDVGIILCENTFWIILSIRILFCFEVTSTIKRVNCSRNPMSTDNITVLTMFSSWQQTFVSLFMLYYFTNMVQCLPYVKQWRMRRLTQANVKECPWTNFCFRGSQIMSQICDSYVFINSKD